MQICFVKMRHNMRSGWRPDLPKNCGFSLLADARGLHWGIYQISSDQDFSSHPNVRPVSPKLRSLVHSAKMYPPALALARAELSRKFANREPTQIQFGRAYASSLKQHLQSQNKAPFKLIESAGDEVGYLTRGEFYWVVGFNKETESVSWVSHDYFIYHNPVKDFKINPSALRELTRS